MEIKENKEDIIKILAIKDSTNVAYIINTILNVVNRWGSIKIYIFNVAEKYKEGDEKK